MHDVDGLAHYLAWVFQKTLPGVSWGINASPREWRDANYHSPVLKVGSQGEINVLRVACVMAIRLRDGRRDPVALRQVFRAWVDPLTKATQ